MEMSANSSSFTDSSLPTSYLLTSNLTLNMTAGACFRSQVSIFVFTAFSITSFLLLPFYVLTLYLGFQRWRQQGSSSTAGAGHADLFLYHSILMQLITLLGGNCCYCGGYMNLQPLMFGGLYVCSITTIGQSMFHVLTSVERYVAVVHPLYYLSLRTGDEVGVRNVVIGCVWLLSAGWLAVCCVVSYEVYMILHGFCMVLSSLVLSFCSISVLCALKRPGPGAPGGSKERGDQSKQRAFQTIVVILGVLSIRFTGNLVINVVYRLQLVDPSNFCVALVSISWVDLPSSLVLPLLFLQRMGKLHCCKHNNQDEGRR